MMEVTLCIDVLKTVWMNILILWKKKTSSKINSNNICFYLLNKKIKQNATEDMKVHCASFPCGGHNYIIIFFD